VIAGTGYIKSANGELLARDEGSGSNLFMEVVTYKTVQERMTPATATFFLPWMQLRTGPSSSEGHHLLAYDIQAAIVPRTTCGSDQQPGSTTTRSKGDVVLMCDQVQETAMTVSPPGDILCNPFGPACNRLAFAQRNELGSLCCLRCRCVFSWHACEFGLLDYTACVCVRARGGLVCVADTVSAAWVALGACSL
jgi:hypothetical protein